MSEIFWAMDYMYWEDEKIVSALDPDYIDFARLLFLYSRTRFVIINLPKKSSEITKHPYIYVNSAGKEEVCCHIWSHYFHRSMDIKNYTRHTDTQYLIGNSEKIKYFVRRPFAKIKVNDLIYWEWTLWIITSVLESKVLITDVSWLNKSEIRLTSFKWEIFGSILTFNFNKRYERDIGN